MIVSECLDSLLASAYRLMNAAAKEENFLQLHGGLHYGKILERSNSYFGSAINLTSRIAAQANAGSFWCSDDFVNSLSDKSNAKLDVKGSFSFKNVQEQKKIFELKKDHANPFHIDSVCRMIILDTEKAVKCPGSDTIFFCSTHCLDTYLKKASNSVIAN